MILVWSYQYKIIIKCFNVFNLDFDSVFISTTRNPRTARIHFFWSGPIQGSIFAGSGPVQLFRGKLMVLQLTAWPSTLMLWTVHFHAVNRPNSVDWDRPQGIVFWIFNILRPSTLTQDCPILSLLTLHLPRVWPSTFASVQGDIKFTVLENGSLNRHGGTAIIHEWHRKHILPRWKCYNTYFL